jgi:propanol-preferring alcohol dehydrogenase
MTCSWAQLPAPTPAGQVGGHEGVGKVVKVGPGVQPSVAKIGDRVGIKWVASACGNCGMFLPIASVLELFLTPAY